MAIHDDIAASILALYKRLNDDLTKKVFEIFTFSKEKADTLVQNHSSESVDLKFSGCSINVLCQDVIHVPDASGSLAIFKGLKYQVEDGFLIKTLIDGGKPVFIKDVSNSPVEGISGFKDAHIQSAYFSPMKWQGKTVGIVTLVFNDPYEFDNCAQVAIDSLTQLLTNIYAKEFDY